MPCAYGTATGQGSQLPVNPSPSSGLLKGFRMRDRIIRIRATVGEVARIRELANGRGLPISQLMRCAALGVSLPARMLDHSQIGLLTRTLGELGSIGGNLNQLVRKTNSGRLSGHDADLAALLSEIDALRSRLRELIA